MNEESRGYLKTCREEGRAKQELADKEENERREAVNIERGKVRAANRAAAVQEERLWLSEQQPRRLLHREVAVVKQLFFVSNQVQKVELFPPYPNGELSSYS